MPDQVRRDDKNSPTAQVTTTNREMILKFKVLQNKLDIDNRKSNSVCEKANIPKGRGAKLPV